MQIPLFVIPLIVALISQSLKLILDYRKDRSFRLSNLWTAGGFPSVHSSMSASILTIVLYVSGADSVEFAIAMTFARLFWYDAINVRYEAGIHAKYINEIRLELKDILSLKTNIRHLKERLGHTLGEVAGGIVLGVMLTLLLMMIFDSFIFYQI